MCSVDTVVLAWWAAGTGAVVLQTPQTLIRTICTVRCPVAHQIWIHTLPTFTLEQVCRAFHLATYKTSNVYTSFIEQILVWTLELISNVHSHPDSSLSSLQSLTPSHLHVIAMHWVLDAHDHWNSPHFSGVTLQFCTGREVVVWLYGADGYLAIMLNLLNNSTCMPTLFEIHLY